MSKTIKVILFDLGNVLIDLNYGAAVKRIVHFCKNNERDIINTLMRSEITGIFEEGKLSPEDFFSGVKGLLGLDISYAGFVSIWNEVFFLSAKNRFVYSIANNLKSNYKIGILSNINVLHYEYIKENFPIFNIFDKVFASFQLGSIKPNPSIYNNVLSELKVEPEEVFYTDDREELVKSASALGINSFVFNSVNKLKKDLINSGVGF